MWDHRVRASKINLTGRKEQAGHVTSIVSLPSILSSSVPDYAFA